MLRAHSASAIAAYAGPQPRNPGCAESLQVRGNTPLIVEVIGSHWAVAALLLQDEGVELVELPIRGLVASARRSPR